MVDDTTPQDTNEGDSDGLDAVADRLEAALDRIGRQLDTQGATVQAAAPVALVQRLDGLIGRLRDALAQT
jgi:hypothetical protein